MKNIFRMTLVLLASLLLIVPGTLSAHERRGAHLVAALKDGHYAEGELIAVKPDSILLLSGTDTSIDLGMIKSIRIVRRSKALLGAGCGILAGVVGTVVFAATKGESDDPWKGFWEGLEVAGAAVTFIGGGLCVGFGAGLLAGHDKTIQFEGKSESEVKKALAYLRRKARIRDFK